VAAYSGKKLITTVKCFMVQAPSHLAQSLPHKVGIEYLPTNIRLKWKCIALTNALAYSNKNEVRP
jgi:hypothetical protein